MKSLVPLTDSFQYINRRFWRGLFNKHALKTALQRRIFLNKAAVFLRGGRADYLNFAPGKLRFESIGSVHRALRRTGANNGVHLVDEKNYVPAAHHLIKHGFYALLKIAPILCPGDHRGQIKRTKAVHFYAVRHAAGSDKRGNALRHRGFTNACFSDKAWVILRTAGKNLHNAAKLFIASYYRVDCAFLRKLCEVSAEFIKCGRFLRTLPFS